MFEQYVYKNKGQKLTSAELVKVNSFVKRLWDSQVAKRTKILYRGENLNNYKLKYNLVDANSDMFNDFLFMIGDKGKGYRREYRDKIEKKWKLFNIDDTNMAFFEYIFNKYNNSLRLNTKEILKFREQNEKLSLYFGAKENLEIFRKSISQLSDEDKLRVRDYYLVPLHHLGAKGMQINSFFISATLDFDVACSFATHTNNFKSIVIVSWIPYPIRKAGLTFSYLNHVVSFINGLSFPTYSRSFFPKQKEVSLKGGILPHFILGYINLEKSIFELNPSLFSMEGKIDRVLEQGFDINQSSFGEKIEATNFVAFFTVDRSGVYKQYSV